MEAKVASSSSPEDSPTAIKVRAGIKVGRARLNLFNAVRPKHFSNLKTTSLSVYIFVV